MQFAGCVTGFSSTSPDMDRRFRLKTCPDSWGQIPLAVNDLTRERSRRYERRKGIQMLEPGQNIPQLSSWLVFHSSVFLCEIRDFVTLRT